MAKLSQTIGRDVVDILPLESSAFDLWGEVHTASAPGDRAADECGQTALAAQAKHSTNNQSVPRHVNTEASLEISCRSDSEISRGTGSRPWDVDQITR